jgi:undecaprenyl phosphate-alpha-L-ara4FN deformylase
MRQARDAGHEVGLHAWDHHGWQANAGTWSDAQLIEQIRKGVDTLSDILGDKVDCSAVAGWRADERVIEAKQGFGFRYNSDCRGQSLFQPRLANGQLGTPQIPVDLPTFDEVVGPTVAAKDFNSFILDRFTPEKLNVYTIHAEVEGILMANDFRQLLGDARQRDIRFQPLGDLLPQAPDSLPIGRVVRGALEGREGWLGVQGA